MRAPHTAAALASVCILLTTLAVGGCDGSAEVLDGCHFEITTQSPEEVKGLWVESHAFAQCRARPDRHDVKLVLQYRRSGSGTWTDQASDRSAQIPPSPPRQLRFTVRAACLPGRWRAVATIVATRGQTTANKTAETPVQLLTGCHGR
jgi:hypothetical protein